MKYGTPPDMVIELSWNNDGRQRAPLAVPRPPLDFKTFDELSFLQGPYTETQGRESMDPVPHACTGTSVHVPRPKTEVAESVTQ